MTGPRVPYLQSASTWGSEEVSAAKAVLDSGYCTMGPRVAEFERSFAEWVGARHAVMVNSGSSANLLAVEVMLRRPGRLAPWRAGDEVLVPALAWPTTVWPLVQLGLVPVFCDVDPETLALCLESAASVLSPRTRGMVVIHVQGLAAPTGPYVEFCRAHDLVLIEDCCETVGAHSGGRHVGTFGAVGTFSTYFSHQLVTIEGGLVVTDDLALADDLRSARSHGWARDRTDRETWATRYPEIDERFMFIGQGYNVRPTDLQGAIGSVQLRKLGEMLRRREALAGQVHEWLPRWVRMVGIEHLPPFGTCFGSRESRRNSWMSMMLMVERGAPCGAGTLRRYLAGRGVESRPIIAGNLTRHPGAAGIACRRAAGLEVADDVFERGLMLGCHPFPAEGSLETLEAALAGFRNPGSGT